MSGVLRSIDSEVLARDAKTIASISNLDWIDEEYYAKIIVELKKRGVWDGQGKVYPNGLMMIPRELWAKCGWYESQAMKLEKERIERRNIANY